MNIKQLIRAALREDFGSRGDVTTRFFIPPQTRLSGRIIAKEKGVICGTEIAGKVFHAASSACRVKILVRDGRPVRPGQTVMKVSGGPALLSAERTALNFLQRMSGIATLTAAYARGLRGSRAKVYDTRKTLPGWRELDKYAVRRGGGINHRMGLYDAVLVKDNHWSCGRDIVESVKTVRRKYPGMKVEIEAAGFPQVRLALEAGADIILLDNMPGGDLRRAIKIIRKAAPKTAIEISGGVSLKNIHALGRLGADRISVGRITHSAPALDLSLEIP
ncbi:MAG: nicotinate-nucleotide diphosphorylase (carboxylating) [Elusimicrobia bacterium RIFCSPHIGHO2_02_FULL_57_9]|nr:MAG: nicotinate-nucleotide diphosphorylase (carboxylating) [Elusimicrobia bacterium RIFCSPHIGHO2_02_FULL_57_9]